MKKWKLKVKNSPQEIIDRLESIDGLVFNAHPDRKNSIKFQIRKRILYVWYLIYDNSIIVNGKLSKTDTENETDMEILFNQHLLWKSVIFLHIFLGLGFLLAIIIKSSNVYWYLFGALILALGVLLWVKVQKKFERNIQEYKTLISQSLGI
jgi:hypothetical protein